MSSNKEKIRSSINILGGFNNFEKIPEILSNPDISLVERTVSSQKRYVRAIRRTFLQFESSDAEMLFINAMKSSFFSEDFKMHVLALQFYSVDELFKVLFNKCFVKILQNGRISINKHDIIAYLDEQIRSGEIEIDWTRETIETVSRKFLTILKKLGFVEGKVKKTIREPYTASDFLIFFHYWLIAHNEASNILTSFFFPLLLVSKEKYLFLMKQPEIREKLDWEYTGEKFKVEPKLTLKDYTHELSN